MDHNERRQIEVREQVALLPLAGMVWLFPGPRAKIGLEASQQGSKLS